jgi:hypothetical protein
LPYTPEPTYEVEASTGLLDWHLPSISTDLTTNIQVRAQYRVEGYYYDAGLQPNLIEVWSEKSGDDATLVPLARRYGINYCPGIGFQSVTNIRRMFQRVRDTQKPTRILYISDFDPAGMGMPVQVGRQTQYAIWQLQEIGKQEAPNVRLEPIALTQEQVVEWELPRKPIKDEDLRKGAWEDRFGEGAVEVDALEARHPGRLRDIVRSWIASLQDQDLAQRVNEAREEAEELVVDAVEEIVEYHREEARETVEEFNAVAERYRERLETLSAQFEEEVGPLRERLEVQRAAFEADLEGLDLELPDLPMGNPPNEVDGWMFDSDRDFTEQTTEFQRRQKRRA